MARRPRWRCTSLLTEWVLLHKRAPSAGNARNWAFIVVRDAEQRRKLGAIYPNGSEIASAMYAARSTRTWDGAAIPPLMTSGAYWWIIWGMHR